MHRADLALAPFLDRLRARLEAIDAEQLRDALLAHARTLEPASRTAFLAIFELGEEAAPTGDDSLLGDIDELVGRLRTGEFFDGFGWDDDLHDEHSYGDESWTPSRWTRSSRARARRCSTATSASPPPRIARCSTRCCSMRRSARSATFRRPQTCSPPT